MANYIPVLIAFSAALGLAQDLQLDASSVANAGSYIASGDPNGGISHGGMFIVKAAAGSGPLGACGVKLADRFPIATNLGGTSMKIAMGGSSFDVPMIYVVACSGTDQLAGIVPSNVPVGTGTLTVSYNGGSATAPLKVVERTLGFFTINQGGTGAAIVQNYNSGADTPINTLATPAKPGQFAIAWGTGLGPDGNSDVEAPKATDIPINLEFYVGGKRASVSYKGRSGCCAGIDQIVFQVPDGLDGCYVPVVAKIGNSVSNFTTMSVSANGGPCSDAGGFTADDVRKAQSSGNTRLGIVDLVRAESELVAGPASGAVTRVDQGVAAFSDLSFTEFIGMPVREISTPGSCTVWRGSVQDILFDRPPILAPSVNLDAGTIKVTAEAGAVSMNYRGGYYNESFGTTSYTDPLAGPLASKSYLEPGSIAVSSTGGGPIPGGTLIGPFSAQINVSAPPRFENRFSVSEVQRDQGVTVNWSGVSAGTVEIRGASSPNTPGASGVGFFCIENASAGKFTIPPYVLLSLPASGSPSESTLGLSVGVAATTRFTAPGVDIGILRFNSLFGRNVNFR